MFAPFIWAVVIIVPGFCAGAELEIDIPQYMVDYPAIESGEKEEDFGLAFSNDKIAIGMLAEFALSYLDVSDESNQHSGELWDLFVSTLELNIAASFTDWVFVYVVVEVEDWGEKDTTVKVNLSECYMTFEHPGSGAYFRAGKAIFPFGVFKDHMLSGTITEDLYEVEKTGATIGLDLSDGDLDLSISVYSGQSIIGNLIDFSTHEPNSDRKKEARFSSYIVNLSATPILDTLECSVFYNSEIGDDTRNESLGGAISYHIGDITFDAEYITAINRELGEDDEENLESAWFVGLAYEPMDMLELGVRFESFDDDQNGDQDEVVRYRQLAGANYSVTETIMLSFEYRYSKFEREPGGEAASSQNEIQFQLSIEFD